MAAKRRPDRMWMGLELRRLEELRVAGLTAAEIAATLGRSVTSVKGRLQVMGVYKPRRALRWLEVLASGVTDAEAARRMGVVPSTVRTARSKLRGDGYDFPDGRSLRYRKGAAG